MRKSVASPPNGALNMTPIGTLAADQKRGTVMLGCPVMLNNWLKGMNATSSRR